MDLSRRQFTKGFKLAAIQRLGMGASVAEMARAFEINPNVLHRWRQEFRQGPGNAFPGAGRRRSLDRGTDAHTGGGEPAGVLSLSPRPPRPDPDLELRDALQHLALELPSYGWPRMTGELKRRAWALDRTLEAELTLQALRMALARRRPAPGLVHHSDRGVQYASRDYTQLLQNHGIRISMSRKGNPWDNAACESFLKTLKYEEVYRSEYRDLTEARAGIRAFLKRV